MGSVLSLCCGPRDKKTGEREPLLPTHREQQEDTVDTVLPSRDTWNKLADLLAAVHNGKLPSTEQTVHLVRRALASQVFQEINKDKHDTLSRRGQVVLKDLQEVLHAFVDLALEKDDDDKVQDTLDELRHMRSNPLSLDPDINLHLAGKDAAVSELPDGPPISQGEAQKDAKVVRDSIQNLISLLFTSSAFRLILTDVFVTGRLVLADLISSVGEAAQVVVSGANVVEGVVRPSEDEQKQVENKDPNADAAEQLPDTDEIRQKQAEIKVEAEKSILNTVNESKEMGQDAWARVKEESPDRVKQTVIERIKAIVSQAQENPDFQSSLQTIMDIAQKYFEVTVRTAAQVSSAAQAGLSSALNDSSANAKVEVDVDPHLQQAFHNLNVLVERFAGQSVDPLITKANVIVEDAQRQVDGNADDDSVGGNLQTVLAQAKDWLNKAINDPQWAKSDEGTQQLGQIYDSSKNVVDGDAEPQQKLKGDLGGAIQAFQSLASGFVHDQALQRFLKAIATLSIDTSYIVAISKPDVMALATRQARDTAVLVQREIRNDIMGFILPRVMKAIRVIPLPRIEFKSPTVDAVLDDLNLSSVSFVPDVIKVTNWSEVAFVGSDRAYNRHSNMVVTASGVPTVTVSEALSRTRIHIEGLRVSARDIAYFVDARGPLFLGWRDHGLVTLDVGERGSEGQGMKVDIELEMSGEDLDVESSHTHDRQLSLATAGYFKVLDVKVDAPGLGFTISKSHHWIFNSLLLQPLLGPTVRQALATVLASQIRAGLEGLDAKLSEAKRKAIKEGSEPPSWAELAQAFYSVATESEDTPRHSGPPDPVTTTSVTTKGVILTSHQPATTHDQDTVVAVGIGEQIITDVPLPQPSIENGGHAKKVEDVAPIMREEGREALDELQDGVDQTKQKASDVVETAQQARQRVGRDVQAAGERLQRRDEMERRKDGWRSDAFNIS